MIMMDLIVNFLEQVISTSDLLVVIITSIITAYLTAKIQKYFEKKKTQEELFFEVYMKLIELSGWQFWLASAHIKEKESSQDITQKVFQLKWQIADISRKLEVKELKDILEVLFLDKFSPYQRYQELSKIIDRIGQKVNSKYRKITQSIDKENLKNYAKELENSH